MAGPLHHIEELGAVVSEQAQEKGAQIHDRAQALTKNDEEPTGALE